MRIYRISGDGNDDESPTRTDQFEFFQHEIPEGINALDDSDGIVRIVLTPEMIADQQFMIELHGPEFNRTAFNRRFPPDEHDPIQVTFANSWLTYTSS